MSRFEPGDDVRYDGIPPFHGCVIEYDPAYEMAVNDLVDDRTQVGPAFAILTDQVNGEGKPIVTWVWANDQCLVADT